MTCRFFRTTITGTNETKLNLIKTWMESEWDEGDIVLGSTGVTVYADDTNPSTYVLNTDLYLSMTVDVDKYTNKVSNHANQLDKAGISHILVVQYDNCSHDTTSPQPCSPDTRFEWVSE